MKAFAFLILLASATTYASNDSTGLKATPELLTKGKQVYATNCATCHGEHGDGRGPASATTPERPRNFVKGRYEYGSTPGKVFKTVTRGIVKDGMPSFATLSEEERWAVVHYILSLKKKR